MNHDTTDAALPDPLSRRWGGTPLWTGVIVVLVWRIAALVRPHPSLTDPQARARWQRRLWFVVTALLLGSLPQPIASALGFWPDYDGLLNLCLAVIPMALAMSLVRPDGGGASQDRSRSPEE